MNIIEDEEKELELDNGDGAEELYERNRFIVTKGQEPIRIDKYLMSKIEGATRNKIQRAIEEGFALVNTQTARSLLFINPPVW